MPLDHAKSVPFWNNENVYNLNREFVLLFKGDADPRGRWPDAPPSLDDIIQELSLTRLAYVLVERANDGNRIFVSLLTGRFLVRSHIASNKEGELRLQLSRKNGFNFASNRDRARTISKGIRVSHNGIYILDGRVFHAYERLSSYWASGEYAREIANLADQERNCAQPEAQTSQAEDLTPTEHELIQILQHYVDAEYELEQQAARETPPFHFIQLDPEPRQVTYRQYFRLHLVDADYKRLRELRPSLLALEQPNVEEAIPVDIVNIEPTAGKPEIIIAIEKQVGAEKLPNDGRLQLIALPTLKKARSAVLQTLKDRQSDNPWLIPCAAEVHQAAPLVLSETEGLASGKPLNPSQTAAINAGACTPDYLLVLGPPGTGKTTVIGKWVEHFTQRGKRILVTSQNNQAVDNVLERLVENCDIQCVRLGSENKVSVGIQPILLDNIATVIQKRLVGKLNDTQAVLQESIVYSTALKSRLSQLPAFQARIAPLAKQASKYERRVILPLHVAINKRRDKLNRLIVLIPTLEDRIQSTRATIERLSHAVWLKPWALLVTPLYRWRISRLQKKINKRQKKRTRFENRIADVQSKLDACDAHFRSFKNEQDAISREFSAGLPHVPRLFIPEWGQLPVGVLLDAVMENEMQRVTLLAEKYQRIQPIISDWERSITGERQPSLYAMLLSLVDVVGATCIGINTNSAFANTPFDVVIVDESGQIQLHNLIVPLSRAPIAILVGDHKQLPPVVQDDITNELEERGIKTDLLRTSWFEHLWNRRVPDRKHMLDTQFRCPKVISDYISNAFYNDLYHAGPGMEKKKPLQSLFNSPIAFLDTQAFPAQRRREQSVRAADQSVIENNPLETTLVVEVLRRVANSDPTLLEAREMGVIAPYANHVRHIQSAIMKAQRAGALPVLKTPVRELAATVDSFQGQERDVIIITFTRSNPLGRVGFLRDWRRLNVAMTRAKRQLIMIGDLSTLTNLTSNAEDAPDREFKLAMQKLEAHVRDQCHYIDARTWDVSRADTAVRAARRPRSPGGLPQNEYRTQPTMKHCQKIEPPSRIPTRRLNASPRRAIILFTEEQRFSLSWKRTLSCANEAGSNLVKLKRRSCALSRAGCPHPPRSGNSSAFPLAAYSRCSMNYRDEVLLLSRQTRVLNFPRSAT